MARPLPKFDRLGRPQRDLHRLFSHIEGINWVAERAPVRQVPSGAWAIDGEYAVIACPCGTDCSVEILDAPHGCGGCERFYAFTGRDVWCFNSPHDQATPVPVS